MEIMSVTKLLKRWEIDHEDLLNRINNLSIPVYVETPEPFKDGFPARVSSETRWGLTWTQLSPVQIKLEMLKADNCPFVFKVEDIIKTEKEKIRDEGEYFWTSVFKNDLPANVDIKQASKIITGLCREILRVYKNLKGVTSTDSNVAEKWKTAALETFDNGGYQFKYLKRYLLEDEEIYAWYNTNPKRVFTGKLLVATLKSYDLTGAVGTVDIQKLANLFNKINSFPVPKN